MTRSASGIKGECHRACARLAVFLALSASSAAAQNLGDIAPCLSPQESGAAFVAAFEPLGWTRTTEGPEFTRAARATTEAVRTVTLFPFAFESSDEASDFLTHAHWRAEERAADAVVFTRDDQNLQIEILETNNRAFFACYWTARRLPIVEERLDHVPAVGPTGQEMAFNMAILPLPEELEGAQDAQISLVRLIIPFPASLLASGGQAVVVSLTLDMDEVRK